MARATTTVVGLAIMLALVLGVASTALGKDGNPFILGKANNVATKVTGLIGKVASGSALVVKNPSGGSALELSVGNPLDDPTVKTVAPMKVDSQAHVDNFNADLLDGKSYEAYQMRVDGQCAEGSSIQTISQDGQVTCETDFASSTHLHDDRYFTETESDNRFVNESDHTKATHDALDIDADTLDGKDSTRFISSSTYERRTTITGAVNSFRSGTATCDSGDRVLSGGFYGINDADDYIQASHPSLSDPQGWYIQFKSGATAETLTVFVLCSNV